MGTLFELLKWYIVILLGRETPCGEYVLVCLSGWTCLLLTLALGEATSYVVCWVDDGHEPSPSL